MRSQAVTFSFEKLALPAVTGDRDGLMRITMISVWQGRAEEQRLALVVLPTVSNRKACQAKSGSQGRPSGRNRTAHRPLTPAEMCGEMISAVIAYLHER